MADELDFGSPATSTSTSSDDFTATTLMTGFADTSLDHTDTLGGDAPARTAGTVPHVGGSSGNAATRRAPLQRVIPTGLRTHSNNIKNIRGIARTEMIIV